MPTALWTPRWYVYSLAPEIARRTRLDAFSTDLVRESAMGAKDLICSLSVTNRPDPQFEIFRTVIRAVPVFMVDALKPMLQSPAENLFHNDCVFWANNAIDTNHDVSFPSDVAISITSWSTLSCQPSSYRGVAGWAILSWDPASSFAAAYKARPLSKTTASGQVSRIVLHLDPPYRGATPQGVSASLGNLILRQAV